MNAPPQKQGRLALENGAVFQGQAFGAIDLPDIITGEVVFNTAMCGYQEALSDPSYRGQILTMTAPMVGNYGVTDLDCESSQAHVSGFVVRELARRHSNHRATSSLSDWLAEQRVLAIEGVDTRALVRLVRTEGAMRGAICAASTGTWTDDDLVEAARASTPMAGQNLAATVSPGSTVTLPGASSGSLRIVALDCGAKRNIYRLLEDRGCAVTVVPHDLDATAIRDLRPDGLIVSNGPGDPAAVEATTNTLREIAGELPTMGICLGHQLLAIALGARTYKLKFGHRGGNQPVRDELTGRVEITSQNHGFCVDADSLAGIDCRQTHTHLNDGTVAGFCHLTRPIFSVQFHPEASPGPHDSAHLFDRFIEMVRSGNPTPAPGTSQGRAPAPC